MTETRPAPTLSPSADLTCRLLTPADREVWDAFAAGHPHGNFCQAWDWGEVKARGEWRPLRLGVFDGGDLRAGCQVLLRSLPLGRTLAYATRGPLVGHDPLDEARAALLAGLEATCRDEGAIALKVDPCQTPDEAAWIDTWGAEEAGGAGFGGTQPKYVMRLDLSSGLDEVFSNFKSAYRNRVRKAGRKGVTVTVAETEAEWRAFYDDLLVATADRQDFAVRAWSYFDTLRTTLTGACRAALFLAHREGRAVGGILNIQYGPQMWYLYGGMNDEGRDHYSGYLLQWEAMQWAAERGATVYDFRGVAPFDQPDHANAGLNRFKAGFAPDEVTWAGEFDKVFAPLWHRAFTVAVPKVKALLKRRG